MTTIYALIAVFPHEDTPLLGVYSTEELALRARFLNDEADRMVRLGAELKVEARTLDAPPALFA